MLKVYGLKNCDTCRTARKWLKAQDVSHEFLDVRDVNLDAATISEWVAHVGVDVLLNKRGTTWRKLDDSAKEPMDDEKAIALMAVHPALIKRPIFVKGDEVFVGFAKTDAERGHLLG